jgi:signal transduction histidine kinase/CheY-like chemotaxis protein
LPIDIFRVTKIASSQNRLLAALLRKWTLGFTLIFGLLLSLLACFGALRSEGSITRSRFQTAATNRIVAIEREFENFYKVFRASRSFLQANPRASTIELGDFLDQMSGSHRLNYSAHFESGPVSFRIDKLQLDWPAPPSSAEEAAWVFPCHSSTQTRFCFAISGLLAKHSVSQNPARLTVIAAIPDLVEEAVSYLKPHGVDMEILVGSRPVYRHLSRLRKLLQAGPLEALYGGPEFSTEKWTFLGHTWTLALSSVPGYLSIAATWQPWGVLFSGILISVLLAWCIHFVMRYARLVEQGSHFRMETMKAARDEAVAASMLKSRFLANVSHEIRTPLNGVLGMAAFLLESPLDSEQREYTRTIQQSGELLLRLINDLLDLSKIESGSVVLAQDSVDLKEVIQTSIDILSELAYSRGLRLEVNVGEGIPRYLAGDEHRIRQILLNLMNNSLKFTTRGHVRLSLQSLPDRFLRFSVEDTGPGIEPEILDRLFQRFSMGDSSSARRHAGTGLGLAISRELVDRMGGRIWVETHTGDSQQPSGSTFSFTLSLQNAPCGKTDLLSPADIQPPLRSSASLRSSAVTREILAPSTPIASPTPSGASILVVEDNVVNQRVTLGMLKKLGYQADVASDGREAVAAFRSKPYHLILMDCQMPEMDGFEATLAIRQLEAGSQRVPIVALTANVMTEDRQRCLDAQMDDHLAKPLHLDALQSILNKWVSAADLAPL